MRREGHEEDSSRTVSYTHLDVYKRQVEALPVSEEYRRKIRAHLREFLPKESAKAALYFQDDEEAADALNLNRTHIRELRMRCV